MEFHVEEKMWNTCVWITKMWIPSTKSMLLSTGMYIYIYIYICVFNVLYYIILYYIILYYIILYIYDAQWID